MTELCVIALGGSTVALLVAAETYFCMRRVIRALIDSEDDYVRRIVREELARALPPGQDAAVYYGVEEEA
jgi:hypothetical protein